jgi:hypothetical protein
MMTKRDFIKSTAAAGAAAGFIRPALATSALATVAPTFAPTAIAAVIYDDRLPESRAFAFEFAQRGIQPFETGDDVATLWNGALGTLLEERPKARIAGLTVTDDFEALRRLAAERSLSTLYEGSHDFRPTRMTTEIVHSGPRSPDFVWMMRDAGADWPPTLAHAVLVARLTGPGRQHERVVTLGANAPSTPEPLTSWVIG